MNTKLQGLSLDILNQHWRHGAGMELYFQFPPTHPHTHTPTPTHNSNLDQGGEAPIKALLLKVWAVDQ